MHVQPDLDNVLRGSNGSSQAALAIEREQESFRLCV